MKLKEITNYLELVAPLRFQESYDNSGLIVGDPELELTGVLISLDATEAVLDDAIEKGCNMIISHHPIVFRGIKKFSSASYVNRVVMKAIKNDISLYAIHTNLDNVLQHGVNEKICKKLELQNIEVLKPHPSSPMETKYDVGSGALGHLKQPMTSKSFIEYLKEKMSVHTLRHTAILDKEVSKISVCGGAGSFLLPSALNSGADVFITADYKYHEFFDADGKIIIFDIGHYESECYTIELLYELISKKFHNFAAHYTKVNTNPVFYS